MMHAPQAILRKHDDWRKYDNLCHPTTDSMLNTLTPHPQPLSPNGARGAIFLVIATH